MTLSPHLMMSSSVAVIVFTSFLILYYLSVKRSQNHRLPPSPPSLPIIGHLHHLGPLIHRSFHNLSTRYGPIIYLRLGSVPCIVISTPDLAQQFLKTNESAFASRRQTLAIEHITYGLSLAFSPNKSYWKVFKKISMVELLGNRNLGHFLTVRSQEIHELLQTLITKSKRKESVNLTRELTRLTNNMISQMMMSIRCSETNSDAEEAGKLVREATKIFGEFNVSDFIWFCKNMDLQGFKKRYEDIHRRYDVLLEKIILDREEKRREKKNNNNKGKDFLDMLLDVLEDDNAEFKITRQHIKALILDFFTAATDSAAISIEWTLVELIRNPKILEEARKEIDQVVGNERLVKESDAPNLPYIQAIIKESLRLHPPVPMLGRESIEKVTIQGYDIPAGSLLFVNNWSIGRNPNYWEDPLEFKPLRFLGNDASIDVRGQSFQLLPFGTGRRGCPGIDLATIEISLVVAILIQCFEWNIMDEHVLSIDEKPGLAVPRAEDFVCVPVLRGNSWKINFSFLDMM